jgi:hypothetical protein
MSDDLTEFVAARLDEEGMDMQIIGEWGSSQDEPDAHLPLLKIMAAVYSDHPDYRPEWRP